MPRFSCPRPNPVEAFGCTSWTEMGSSSIAWFGRLSITKSTKSSRTHPPPAPLGFFAFQPGIHLSPKKKSFVLDCNVTGGVERRRRDGCLTTVARWGHKTAHVPPYFGACVPGDLFACARPEH